jgi:hypothetical protein
MVLQCADLVFLCRIDAIRNLPTPADDKYPYIGKVSPAALDLASQREKGNSEWPQFESARGPDGLPARTARRVATNPPIGGLGDKVNGTASATATPLLQQPIGSRRGSPLPMPMPIPDTLAQMAAAARSVPGTPLGGLPNSVAAHLMRSGAATPLSNEIGVGSRLGSQLNESPVNAHDLQASLTRLGNTQYDNNPLTFNSIRSSLDDVCIHGYQCRVRTINSEFLIQFEVDPSYSLNNGLGNDRFSNSPSLYGNGGRFGTGVGSRSHSADKMNGLQGAKHKRGEMDRECAFLALIHKKADGLCLL